MLKISREATNLLHRIHRLVSIVTLVLVVAGCTDNKQTKPITPGVVFEKPNLIITQITENSFIHTSYKQTEDFGNVPCNGLVVRDNKEVIVFDTPTNDSASEVLLKWIRDSLEAKVNAVIPTHFHDDCLGGLKAFHDQEIPSYANTKTLELATQEKSAIPQQGFNESMTLHVGNVTVEVKFFGEGHTRDNVVGYFPSERVLFGGCLIKEVDASKGYLADANIKAWPTTVEKVKRAYPNVQLVIPGHGAYGGPELLDYTVGLFRGE